MRMPASREAIAEQAATLVHTSNLFFHPLQGRSWRERRRALSGLERAFFCNSGTEAVEACLKFARRYWYTQRRAAADEVRGARRTAFHGRTLGSRCR